MIIIRIQELITQTKIQFKFNQIKIRGDFDPEINKFSQKLIRIYNKQVKKLRQEIELKNCNNKIRVEEKFSLKRNQWYFKKSIIEVIY